MPSQDCAPAYERSRARRSGRYVRELRQARGWSRTRLAEQAGVSERTVARLAGKTQLAQARIVPKGSGSFVRTWARGHGRLMERVRTASVVLVRYLLSLAGELVEASVVQGGGADWGFQTTPESEHGRQLPGLGRRRRCLRFR